MAAEKKKSKWLNTLNLFFKLDFPVHFFIQKTDKAADVRSIVKGNINNFLVIFISYLNRFSFP